MVINQVARWSDRRKERLKTPVTGRLLGAAAFSVWISGAIYLGIGTHEFGAAVDAAGYGIQHPFTSATGLFFSILVCFVVGLTYAKFQEYFGFATSFFLGIVTIFSTVIFGFSLLPMHYGQVCDKMDAMNACDAATNRVRKNCKPGLRCFPRVEKACRLGSERACPVLIKNGQYSEEKVCSILHESCAAYTACTKLPDSAACFHPDLPRIERMRDPCSTHEKICEPQTEPAN